MFSEDIWSQSRVDVKEVFEFLKIGHYNITDLDGGSQFDVYLPSNMTETKMMIKTRPRFPSNKLTFSIDNICKGRTFHFLDINLNYYAKYDVDLFLEDSNRNF